jgi:hypothetical protein
VFTPRAQRNYTGELILRADETHQVVRIALGGYGSLDETFA